MAEKPERLKLVFCGTPQFAVPTLEALLGAGHEVALVVSQPDRPVGRAQALTAPPVKQSAISHGLRVVQPEKIRNNQEFQADLEEIAPEAIVVVAYGRIIPAWMLKLPRMGCINLHASLLPKYRGAAPIQWAVANGDAFTGNTTMLLEEGLDTGPILLQQMREIRRDETAADLFEELARAGAPLVVETLAGLESGSIQLTRQNDGLATMAPLLSRDDGWMDFGARAAHEIYNRWRGFQPWPGAFTALDGKKLIVHRMKPAPERTQVAEPGLVCVEGDRLFAACAGNTWIELVEVQLEGKKRISAAEFLRGAGFSGSTRLG